MKTLAANQFDVVIAGGGVAGASVAAALTEFGYRILIVEPGISHSRRLAGELIHPHGVNDLTELGLLDPGKRCIGVPVRGFAVFPDANRDRIFRLHYAQTPGRAAEGYSAEHGVLTGHLLAEVERLPHVTVWSGARVVGLELEPGRTASVTVHCPDGDTRLAAQMVVAADGANSQVRSMAGIHVDRRHVSHMISYTLSAAHLPAPAFGNVFLGAPAPVLAYQIGAGAARVMFDFPGDPRGVNLPEALGPYLDALPEEFRSEARSAIENRKPVCAATYCVTPDTVEKGRLVCVGDAAGCCHPLSATGLSVCTRDAVRLRDSIRATRGDIPKAFREHARRRRGPQRTRLTVARILYDAFSGRTPQMRMLREGILRYWEGSQRGRAASMALLSLSEDRMTRLACEYSCASWFAFRELCESGQARKSVGSPRRAIIGLSHSTVQYVREALGI